MRKGANPSDRSDAPDAPVRASELAAYTYCHRAWWLGSAYGAAPDGAVARRRGERRHNRRAQAGVLSGGARRMAFLLALSGFTLLVISLLASP